MDINVVGEYVRVDRKNNLVNKSNTIDSHLLFAILEKLEEMQKDNEKFYKAMRAG